MLTGAYRTSLVGPGWCGVDLMRRDWKRVVEVRRCRVAYSQGPRSNERMSSTTSTASQAVSVPPPGWTGAATALGSLRRDPP
jgi:hypothetical protein